MIEDSQLICDFTDYVNDIDGDELVLTAISNLNVQAAINGMMVSFTAPANWNGSETLTFNVNDIKAELWQLQILISMLLTLMMHLLWKTL